MILNTSDVIAPYCEYVDGETSCAGRPALDVGWASRSGGSDATRDR